MHHIKATTGCLLVRHPIPMRTTTIKVTKLPLLHLSRTATLPDIASHIPTPTPVPDTTTTPRPGRPHHLTAVVTGTMQSPITIGPIRHFRPKIASFMASRTVPLWRSRMTPPRPTHHKSATARCPTEVAHLQLRSVAEARRLSRLQQVAPMNTNRRRSERVQILLDQLERVPACEPQTRKSLWTRRLRA